jgi:hypothetical protein
MITSAPSAPLAGLLQQVREHYRKMPGLALTKPQAMQLFGVAPSVCAAMLRALVMENFLARSGNGEFVRSTVVSLVTCFSLVACLAAAGPGQAPSSNGRVNPKAIQSIRVHVAGCVEAGDPKAGRYFLTGAFLSGDDVPSTIGTAGRKGSGKDLSFENSATYDLIGGRLKASVGHQVEITGITSDARLNASGAVRSAIGSSTQERTTLMVDSVKMLAAMCR